MDVLRRRVNPNDFTKVITYLNLSLLILLVTWKKNVLTSEESSSWSQSLIVTVRVSASWTWPSPRTKATFPQLMWAWEEQRAISIKRQPPTRLHSPSRPSSTKLRWARWRPYLLIRQITSINPKWEIRRQCSQVSAAWTALWWHLRGHFLAPLRKRGKEGIVLVINRQMVIDFNNENLLGKMLEIVNVILFYLFLNNFLIEEK